MTPPKSSWNMILAVLAIGVCITPTLTYAQPAQSSPSDEILSVEAAELVDADDRRVAVENGLTESVIEAGEALKQYSLSDRLEHYSVPGVSIAVINDGKLEWAAGYGVRSAGTSAPVTASTMFQAASVSKPIAALGALRLVEQGRLTLDDPANGYLSSWKMVASDGSEDDRVTLRQLLSHTAGTTVSGFGGYKHGDQVPDTVGILSGLGNSDQVIVDATPGETFSYSGGGYTVVQLLLEDVSGLPFASALEQLVLRPLEMGRSSFLPPETEEELDQAIGHDAKGVPIDGGWRVHPELAAAGLWSTPSDIARFALAIRAAYLGHQTTLLDKRTAIEMLTPQVGGYGLGPGLGGSGDTLLFAHPGGNVGYRAFFVMYPATGDGAVVMSNGDNANDLNMEIIRAVARVYGWPHFQPEVRPRD